MTIQYTPALALAYADSETALTDLGTASQQLAQSVEAALVSRGIAPADIQALVAAGWFTDTTTTVQPSTGFGANGGGLQLRKIGKRVTCLFGFSSTGIVTLGTSYTVVTAGGIPAAYRPPSSWYGPLGTSHVNNTGRGVIGADGSVIVQPGGSAIANYYRFDTATWNVP